jgi:integrase
MAVLYGVRFTGPLTAYAPGFSAELARLGFTKFSSQTQLGLAAHLSRWLDQQGLGTAALTPATVDRFLAARRAVGYTAYRTPKSLRPLLDYLRELGAAPSLAESAPATLVEALVERYHGYLIAERGLTVNAARGYIDLVRPFVVARVNAGELESLQVTAGDVTSGPDHSGLRQGRQHRAPHAGTALADGGYVGYVGYGGCVMTNLTSALADYLDLRRSLGYGLKRDARLLAQLIAYLTERGTNTITVADAVAWATLPADPGPSWLGFRMSVVRGFATYLHTLDPAVEVPPPGLLPGQSRRAVPYLYCDADIAALFAQAERLRTPLRTATMQMFIGLMTVTGMRGGEVVGLDEDDFDPVAGLLTIRNAKLGKWRQVPLHPTTVTALQGYRRLRDQFFPRPVSEALLVSAAGTRLFYCNVGLTFAKLARRAGLTARSASCCPRPHDLRHTFAVRTLLDWYRDGGDVAARLPLLSTYLGHVEPANTYWYLQAAPELLAEAALRLEHSTRTGDPR